MSDSVIRVENLSKKYVISHRGAKGSYSTLRESLASGARTLKNRFLAKNQNSDRTEEFWALQDVSFDVKRGEVVGIIGRNGAGKSTLLKLLSRITEPTSGRITIEGRVASLLEVGTGFHPELTGRENIYLNGSILGMSRVEVRRKFDEIVAFAEVEKFLDTPVKRYSSGMYMRLAFAVAAHLEPEILVVDEVLAVGDMEFQKKCLGKMDQVARSGRTVLFVSHNMQAIKELCTKTCVLRAGNVAFEGSVEAGINVYKANEANDLTNSWIRNNADSETKPVFLKEMELTLVGEQPNITLEALLIVSCVGATKPFMFDIDIKNEYGETLMQAQPYPFAFVKDTNKTAKIRLKIELPPLIPGKYSTMVWIGPHNTETFDVVKEAASFEITESPVKGRTFPHTSDHGYIVPRSSVTIE